MLGDWYWTKKLQQLKNDVKNNEKDFYRKIAMIEYHAYSSKKSNRIFPLKGDSLESMEFTKELILQILENRKDVKFLIMRSKRKWKDFLNIDIEGDERFICKDNKSMSQSITPKNLGEEKYNIILSVLNLT